MPDREKVISEFEDFVKSFSKRDDTYYKGLFVSVLALLKEQEAVKRTSRKGVNGFSIIWTCGSCGTDLCPNNAKAKFCSNCGKPILWEGR